MDHSPLTIELYDTLYRALANYQATTGAKPDEIQFSIGDPLNKLTAICGIPCTIGLTVPLGGVDVMHDGWAVIRLWKDGTTRE
jgi:hypothetical protein